MSWNEIYKRTHNNITNGIEYCSTIEEKQNVINSKTKIGHTNCDYCGKEIICIWDEFNSNKWYGYLGNQVQNTKNYQYSPIISILRKYNKIDKVYNLHSRCHTYPNDWSKRAHENALKLLCNDCFRKTYKRISVKSTDGILCKISVLPDRGETIESVMEELEITGEVL